MNITLIGMSGAGKSFIGEKVAKELNLEYVGIDELLEQKFGKPLPGIIGELRDEGFVRAESEMTQTVTASKDGLLISTGGSVIYDEGAMCHLKDVSFVVYLRVPFIVIEQRVSGVREREGRIVGLGKKTLEELFGERAPLYEKYADAIVDVHGKDVGDIISEISDTMSRNG